MGHVRKDNVVMRSMYSLIEHLHALLPSYQACDEISCDDACDAMMMEKLIEMRETREAAKFYRRMPSSPKIREP